MSNTTGPATNKNARSEAPRPSAAVSGRSAAVAVPQALTAERQLACYEHATRLFHLRKFQDARDMFGRAAEGPDRAVAHRAELHIRMCDRRLVHPAVELKTAEDHYNYGIALINSRDLERARQHLNKALEMNPAADHVYYALALSYGLAGDVQHAYENLKRAIDLDARNRIHARQDADFAGLAHQQPFEALLFPEKKQY